MALPEGAEGAVGAEGADGMRRGRAASARGFKSSSLACL